MMGALRLCDDGEARRLAVLDSYDICHEGSSDALAALAREAALALDMTMATICVVGADRHWQKASYGPDSQGGTPDGSGLATQVVRTRMPLVVAHAAHDMRLAGDPAPRIRFFAGAPLLGPDRCAIGALCVMDRQPRSFGTAERALLGGYADRAMDHFEIAMLRRNCSPQVIRQSLAYRLRHQLGGPAPEQDRRAVDLLYALGEAVSLDPRG